jgi:hypothetical protein
VVELKAFSILYCREEVEMLNGLDEPPFNFVIDFLDCQKMLLKIKEKLLGLRVSLLTLVSPRMCLTSGSIWMLCSTAVPGTANGEIYCMYQDRYFSLSSGSGGILILLRLARGANSFRCMMIFFVWFGLWAVYCGI